jgi:hypothetical protein
VFVSRTPRVPRRVAIAAVALAVASAAACGSEGTDSDVSAGDPDYTYEAIADLYQSIDEGLEPNSLVDVLPNREIVFKTAEGVEGKGQFSDLVVAGPITKVAPLEGLFFPEVDPMAAGDEETEVKVVGFDNPDAQERVALVTMQVDWSAGGKVGENLQFRLGVPMDTDANKFLAGVMGIGDAVVLLDQVDEGRDKGSFRPALRSAGLGSVADDGTVSFEGFGDEQDGFMAGIDTLDDLKVQASKPDSTVEY